MHHRSSRSGLCTTLLCLVATGCAPSSDNGVSNDGSSAGGSTAMAGGTSAGGSQGAGGTSGGTSASRTGGTTGLASSGGSTQAGGSTSSNTTSAGGSGGAASTASSVGGSSNSGGASSGGSGAGGAQTGGVTSRGGTSGGSASGGVIASGGSASGGVIASGGSASGGATASGGSASGGTTARGGTTASGGLASGGTTAKGGTTASGGSASGGTTAKGGTTATGGNATGGSTGTPPAGKVFSQCRFHFGTIDSQAKNGGASMISQLDFFTPGWMMGTFNQGYVCTESASGGALAGLVPVDVTYIAANYVKNQNKLCDCNVSGCSGGNLCNYGAQYITQDWSTILSQYTSNSTGFAACLGGRPIIFEMEPDWYQYYAGGQTQAWTPAQAGTNMTALVNALKSSLPNAVFSMDISPWIPNNGSAWYTSFDMGLFTFINTSGGGTAANNTKIRSNNAMTWAGVHQVTGKPILADTGYGANGGSAGPDAAWDVPANINARIADGVVSISQYNPSSSWGSTISGIRSQLSTPSICP
jgi:hypothetical protein